MKQKAEAHIDFAVNENTAQKHVSDSSCAQLIDDLPPVERYNNTSTSMGSGFRSFDDLPLTLKVEDLIPILGIGRNTAYELVRSGQIKSIRIGKQIRVSKDALMDFLAVKK